MIGLHSGLLSALTVVYVAVHLASLTSPPDYMQLAIDAALQHAGHTAPNPPVGATLVTSEGRAVTSAHIRAGGPHAEVSVLQRAVELGLDTINASLYITLEPCNTSGRTPPCVDFLRDKGLSEIVVCTRDPTQASSEAALRESAASVTYLPERSSSGRLCREIIAPFAKLKQSGRPLVDLVHAATFDLRGDLAAAIAGLRPWKTPDAVAVSHSVLQRNAGFLCDVAPIILTDADLAVSARPPLAQCHTPVTVLASSCASHLLFFNGTLRITCATSPGELTHVVIVGDAVAFSKWWDLDSDSIVV